MIKAIVSTLLVLASVSSYADGCTGNPSCPRTVAAFKAARIVQFDIAVEACSLQGTKKEEALKLRESALSVKFESPEWKKIEEMIKRVEVSCASSKK
jgi:hypothetical protein